MRSFFVSGEASYSSTAIELDREDLEAFGNEDLAAGDRSLGHTVVSMETFTRPWKQKKKNYTTDDGYSSQESPGRQLLVHSNILRKK